MVDSLDSVDSVDSTPISEEETHFGQEKTPGHATSECAAVLRPGRRRNTQRGQKLR